MIFSLWSNSAFDKSKEGSEGRQEAIKEIEDKCSEVTDAILGIKTRQDEEEEIDMDNPFWAAMQRGVDKIQHQTVDDTNASSQASEQQSDGS